LILHLKSPPVRTRSGNNGVKVRYVANYTTGEKQKVSAKIQSFVLATGLEPASARVKVWYPIPIRRRQHLSARWESNPRNQDHNLAAFPIWHTGLIGSKWWDSNLSGCAARQAHDLKLPKQTRYLTALHPEMKKSLADNPSTRL
jgi:hypothetical protein